MNPSTFRCGHCGDLLTVGPELLGQAVRCPHCQQVVLPPLATSPTADAASCSPSTPATAGSLFIVDGPTAVNPDLSVPAGPAVVASPALTVTEGMPAAMDLAACSDDTPGLQLQLLPTAGSPQDPPPHDAVSQPPQFPRPLVGGPRQAGPAMSHWFLTLVFIPLVTYAVLATALVVLLYMRLQSPQPSPLELLPDLEGDFRGSTRQKQGTLSYERVPPEAPLPEHLRVRLRETVQVGDVAVTPTQVAWRRLRFLNPGFHAEASRQPALVLFLRFANTSTNVVFCPTDPAFERRWKSDQASPSLRPYTLLEIGQQRFYGGPLTWRPRLPEQGRETLEGQEHRRLGPGEEVQTFICTDPDEPVAAALARHDGPVLWRVQVRRGLVSVRNREVSATAVVGVTFHADDILPSG